MTSVPIVSAVPVPAPSAGSFPESVGRVRNFIEARLPAWLDRSVAGAEACGKDVRQVSDAIRLLVLRGGKRIRPGLLHAAFVAAGGEDRLEDLAGALFSMELLHAYLLIHDDWMDGDDTRRGGPSVHAHLAASFGDARGGEVAAILAGDLALALAQQALSETNVESGRLGRAFNAFAEMQSQVVMGQLMDVRALARSRERLEQMHAMKTASYTTVGPVLMGAALAGADKQILLGLRAFALPLGVAFQLRDDVLGVFGDPALTGKPRWSDLRQHKYTALVAELEEGGGSDRSSVGRILGRDLLTDEACEQVAREMRTNGALARVEARIEALTATSRSALASVALRAPGARWLEGSIAHLAERTR